MSVHVTPPAGTPPRIDDAPATPARALLSRWWVRAILGVIVLAIVARIAGTPDLVSRGSASASLRFAAPILLAGLGGLWAERVGVINIGLEGMMIMGTWVGAWIGFLYGPWTGVLAATLGGMLFGLLHALMTVTFAVDQAVSGLAINLLAAGAARFLSSIVFEPMDGGGVTQSPPLAPIATVSIPGLRAALEPVGSLGIPVVSDVTNVLLGLTTNVSLLTLLALALVPFSYWALWRTSFGLRLRMCGENPSAADSLGVNPNRMRYYALAASGAFAGLGGGFLVTVATNIYREGQTAGRGFIGLATVIFGNWTPGRLGIGALLFGFTDALRVRQEATVASLLILGSVAFVLLAIRAARQAEIKPTIAYSAAAVALMAWYLFYGVVPSEFVGFAPHLTTLLVLALGRQTLRPPAGIGYAYRRSEAT